MTFWVYILCCADNSYYVGHTDNLEVRLAQHQSGEFGGYTAARRPLQIALSLSFPSRDEAFAAERQIKGWTRAKKQALIRGDWKAVSRLAQRRTPQEQSEHTLREPQGERLKTYVEKK